MGEVERRLLGSTFSSYPSKSPSPLSIRSLPPFWCRVESAPSSGIFRTIERYIPNSRAVYSKQSSGIFQTIERYIPKYTARLFGTYHRVKSVKTLS
eukprot:1234-Prorocentrum_minimum.AAC.1